MIQERINHQKQKHGWEFLFFGANMDAIAADRAQNYRSDSVGTSSVYTSMSAMSTAFRTGKPFSSMDLTDMTQEEAEPQSAKANGGKIPDVNEIVRQVLAGKNKEEES